MLMINNLINICGIFSIVVALWTIIFTIRNKNNMPPAIKGLNINNYKIIDKEKFNRIMIIKEISMIIALLILGISIIITSTGDYWYITLLGSGIDLYLSNKSKKYIIKII